MKNQHEHGDTKTTMIPHSGKYENLKVTEDNDIEDIEQNQIRMYIIVLDSCTIYVIYRIKTTSNTEGGVVVQIDTRHVYLATRNPVFRPSNSQLAFGCKL